MSAILLVTTTRGEVRQKESAFAIDAKCLLFNKYKFTFNGGRFKERRQNWTQLTTGADSS